MKKKKYGPWTFTIGAISAVIGILLGTYFTKGFDWASMLGAIAGLAFIYLINLLYVRSKKDNTPEIDERITNNIRAYYAIIANIFIGALFIILATVTYMGYEQIAVSYLLFFVIAYMLLSGIGAFIVSRR